jgi:hypothetical protein
MAPVLIVLALGMTEYGLAFRDKLSIQNATRAAARAESNTNAGGGNHWGADGLALKAINAATQNLVANNIQRVVIYKASSSDGKPSNACVNNAIPASGYGGVSGVCNYFSGQFLRSLPSPWPSTSNAYESTWAPIDCTSSSNCREVRQSVGADYVGIYIKYKHDNITKGLPFLGNQIILTDRSVAQLDPCVPVGGVTCPS